MRLSGAASDGARPRAAGRGATTPRSSRLEPGEMSYGLGTRATAPKRASTRLPLSRLEVRSHVTPRPRIIERALSSHAARGWDESALTSSRVVWSLTPHEQAGMLSAEAGPSCPSLA